MVPVDRSGIGSQGRAEEQQLRYNRVVLVGRTQLALVGYRVPLSVGCSRHHTQLLLSQTVRLLLAAVPITKLVHHMSI